MNWNLADIVPSFASRSKEWSQSPDVFNILRSGRYPSSCETTNLRVAVKEFEKDIKDLDEQAHRSGFPRHFLPIPLQTYRDGLDRQIHGYHSLEAPIRRLPPEILGRIFVFCLPKQSIGRATRVKSSRFVVPYSNGAPLVFCQICHSWRVIALSTPVLWTSLSLTIRRPYPLNRAVSDRSSYKLLLQTWLSRAGSSQPLSVRLVAEVSELSESSPSVMGVLDSLISYSRQWQHISIHLPPTSIKQLFHLPKGSTPLLESFHIQPVDEWTESRHFISRISFLRSSPRLRGLEFSPPISEPRLRSLPWSRLTRIAILDAPGVRLTADDCIHILLSCPNVIHCTLTLSQWPRTDPLGVIPSPFNKLETLRVVSSVPLTHLIESLQTPKLRVLEIQIPDTLDRGHFVGWRFDEFVARSSCQIRKLSLSTPHMLEEDFLACLRCIPSLLSLEVVNRAIPVITDGSLKHLTRESPTDATCPLPSLTKFVVRGQPAFTARALSHMVHSRWQKHHRAATIDSGRGHGDDLGSSSQVEVSQVRSLTVECDASFGRELNALLADFVEDGLVVNLR
ncbi:hypothetical protein JAAARDRAFT_62529 [Jaapia argillacea MUCL 33604]|uniref:Uncharacterized protein n=1 Tax=Jaapia argillacea MUCL 33604 TaxID=933084 RepID=A0A067P947_9AGAM|nr:hypothetical protein JAAARDRAFT_62529 [Jaapia argillacea MUCL 33604]